MILGTSESESRLGGGGGFVSRYMRSGGDNVISFKQSTSLERSSSTVRRDVKVNTIYQRPQFESKALRKEKQLNQIIHTRLAEKGLCDPETLTDLINEAAKETELGENVFNRTSQCVEYLGQRSFLYEKRVTDRYYRNTSFAHRKGILNIVCFIQQKSHCLNGCRLSDLVSFVLNKNESAKKNIFQVYEKEKWKVQPWNDSYFFVNGRAPTEEMIREILLQYPDYFLITDAQESFVGLKSVVFKIPSLWNEILLPSRPTTPYYDRSRLDVYIANIRTTTEDYAKGVVGAGHYEGRRVHFLHTNIGLDNIDLNIHMPAGTSVFSLAHMTIGHTNEVTAINLLPIRSEVNRQAKKEMERSGIDLSEVSTSSKVPICLEQDSQARRSDMREMIAAEQAQIKFIDDILGENSLSEEEIMKNAPSNRGCFTSLNETLEFIVERPYLYEIVNGKASVRTPFERKGYNDFFNFLHSNGKCGMAFDKLRQQLKSGIAGEALQSVAMQEKVQDLLASMKPFVRKYRNMNEKKTYYTLTVAFDTQSKLLLPFYGSIVSNTSTHA